MLGTYSALVLYTIIPESTGREFLLDHQGCPRYNHLPHPHHTPCSVIQGQTIVKDVLVCQVHELVYGNSHVIESVRIENK